MTTVSEESMHTVQKLIRRSEENLHDKVELLRRKIDGEGQDAGVITRLALIEQKINYIKESEEKRQERQRIISTREWGMFLMVAALIVNEVVAIL